MAVTSINTREIDKTALEKNNPKMSKKQVASKACSFNKE